MPRPKLSEEEKERRAEAKRIAAHKRELAAKAKELKKLDAEKKAQDELRKLNIARGLDADSPAPDAPDARKYCMRVKMDEDMHSLDECFSRIYDLVNYDQKIEMRYVWRKFSTFKEFNVNLKKEIKKAGLGYHISYKRAKILVKKLLKEIKMLNEEMIKYDFKRMQDLKNVRMEFNRQIRDAKNAEEFNGIAKRMQELYDFDGRIPVFHDSDSPNKFERYAHIKAIRLMLYNFNAEALYT